MSDLTVADELAYDALPEETRKLCDKIIESRTETVSDEALSVAWQDGYNAGQAAERRKAETPKAAPTIDASALAALPKPQNGEAAD